MTFRAAVLMVKVSVVDAEVPVECSEVRSRECYKYVYVVALQSTFFACLAVLGFLVSKD